MESDIIERLRALTARSTKRRDWVALGQAIQDYDRAAEYSDVELWVETPERWAELTPFQQYCALTCHHPTGRRSGGGRSIKGPVPRISIPASGGSSLSYFKAREAFFEWLDRGGYFFRRGDLMHRQRSQPVMIGVPEASLSQYQNKEI